MTTIQEIRVQYPQYDDLSDQELADRLYQRHYSDMPRDQFNQRIGLTTGMQNAAPDQATMEPLRVDPNTTFKPFVGPGGQEWMQVEQDPTLLDRLGQAGRAADDFVRGAADTLTLGLADEIAARAGSLFSDDTYEQRLAEERARDREGGYARLAGQLAGGVGGGVGMARSGATLMGRSVPGLSRVAPRATQTGLAATEGALYGGAYGAGSGEGAEERLENIPMGAAVGAAAGGTLQAVGNRLATRFANRQAAQQTREALGSGDAASALKAAADDLYARSRAAGVTIKAAPLQRLKNNLKAIAGKPNAELRPRTAGVVRDLDDRLSRNLSLEELDELRQEIGMAMQRADPQDVRRLTQMKNQIDNFSNTIKPGDITGDMKGFEFIREGRKLAARQKKVEVIDRIMDSADVNTGQYTQSGLANAVKKEMRTLYRDIQKGRQKGFTKEEVALIRQMAKGGTASKMTELMAKFAPRGVVSFGAGQFVGSMIPGGNILVPGAGHFAARSLDRSAARNLQALKNAAATGLPPPGKAISQQARRLIAPGAISAENRRQRAMQRSRPQ